MRQRGFTATVSVLCLLLVIGWLQGASAQEAGTQQGGGEDFLIVKYGSLSVKSDQPDAKVLIDEVQKGRVNTVIESVVAGEHAISVVFEDKSLTGTYLVKKNEVLKLDARFKEGKLVHLGEGDTAKKKKEAEAKSKKTEEAKRPEKSPAEERRDLYLNVFTIDFRNRTAQEVGVAARASVKVISGFAESKGQMGKYYRTKSGLLLCETGPCVQEWTSKFFYTDETGKRDAFMVTWKQTVFSGMTPSGTSSREITWCLNGTCKKSDDTDDSNAPVNQELGPYVLTWTKENAHIRRADLMKEVLDAGGKLPE